MAGRLKFQSVREPSNAWGVVAGAFAHMVVVSGVSYSFVAFFDSFAYEFSATRAAVAMVFGLFGLVTYTLGSVGGMLADSYGPRRVCAAGVLCAGAGLLATSMAESILGVCLAYGLGAGAGIALVFTPAVACVQRWCTRRRGLATGIASAGVGVGTLLVPLLAAALIAALEWRMALRVIALVVVLVGLAATALLRRASPRTTAVSAATLQSPSLGQALRTQRFWCLYLVLLAAAPAMLIPFAHAAAAARDTGLEASRAVSLVGLIGGGGLLGRIVIGGLADRLQRTHVLPVTLIGIGLSYGLWYQAGSYVEWVAFALCFGFSYGGTVALLPAICMDLFGSRAVAAILGTLYTGAALGNLLGPVAAGASFDRSGNYTLVIGACVVLSGLAASAAIRLAILVGRGSPPQKDPSGGSGAVRSFSGKAQNEAMPLTARTAVSSRSRSMLMI